MNYLKGMKTVRIKRVQPLTPVRTKVSVSGATSQATSIRKFSINGGLVSLPDLRIELEEYTEVLLGRESPPIDNGELTLMEYANAVYSRAMELTMMIQRAETDGQVLKGSKYYKFRTGELRTFTELALRAIDLGSRRVTWAQMEYSMQHG